MRGSPSRRSSSVRYCAKLVRASVHSRGLDHDDNDDDDEELLCSLITQNTELFPGETLNKPSHANMGRTGYTCIRHVFCSLNVLIWLCACGMLGAGLWMRLNYPYEYGTVVPQHSYASLDILVLGIGGVTFVVAFFGCCGAWFQSRCLLITYFSLMILLFMAEFMVGSLAFVFKDQIGPNVKAQLQEGIRTHYNDRDVHEPGTFANVWDTIQTNLQCCGVDKYYDWYRINSWPNEERVPDSCCRVRERYCGKQYNNDERQMNWQQDGCVYALHMWLVQRLHFIGSACLLLGAFQLFGLVASMILFCTVRHKRSTHTYKSYDTTTT